MSNVTLHEIRKNAIIHELHKPLSFQTVYC